MSTNGGRDVQRPREPGERRGLPRRARVDAARGATRRCNLVERVLDRRDELARALVGPAARP